MGGNGLWDPQEMWVVGTVDCSWCSVAVLGLRLEAEREKTRHAGHLAGFLKAQFQNKRQSNKNLIPQ